MCQRHWLTWILSYGCFLVICGLSLCPNKEVSCGEAGNESSWRESLEKLEVETEKWELVTNETKQNEIIQRTITELFNIVGLTRIRKALFQSVVERSVCVGCKALMSILKKNVRGEALFEAITGTCIGLDIQTPRVCKGVVHSIKPHVEYIRRNSGLTSEEMCDILFGIQCFNTSTQNTRWTIEIPSKPDSFTERQSSGQSFEFGHITDVHIDFRYKPGTSGQCKEPICCRDEDKLKRGEKPAGSFADSRKCDIQPMVFDSLVEGASKRKNVKYWIWTGDSPSHDFWNLTRNQILEHLSTCTKTLKRHKVTRVYPVLGNHEGDPVYSFPPPNVGGQLNISWLYEATASLWSEFLSPEALSTFRKTGYYKEMVSPNLVLLVLNTNYCARLNFWLLYEPKDASGQLEWLVSELTKAERKGYLVHLAMHIPPDTGECTQAWTFNYMRILERFQETISGQFSGHTHHDEFRIFYSLRNESQPIGLQYVSPSVTTIFHTNPAHRTYWVDTNGQVVDFDTHYLNVSEANRGVVNWKQEYSAIKDLQMPDLSIKSWSIRLEEMEKEPKLVEQFIKYYFVSSEYGQSLCSKKECRKRKLNTLKVLHPFKHPLKGFDYFQ